MSPDKQAAFERFSFLQGFSPGVRNGWFQILHDLLSGIQGELEKHAEKRSGLFYQKAMSESGTMDASDPDCPPFKVLRVKEKFGALRVYVNWGTDRIFQLIDLAESLSLKTCESCGKDGQTHSNGGWIKTFCPGCAMSFGYTLEK